MSFKIIQILVLHKTDKTLGVTSTVGISKMTVFDVSQLDYRIVRVFYVPYYHAFVVLAILYEDSTFTASGTTTYRKTFRDESYSSLYFAFALKRKI